MQILIISYQCGSVFSPLNNGTQGLKVRHLKIKPSMTEALFYDGYSHYVCFHLDADSKENFNKAWQKTISETPFPFRLINAVHLY